MGEERKIFEEYEPEKDATMPDEQGTKDDVMGAIVKTKNIFEVLSLYLGQIGSFIGALLKTFLGEEKPGSQNGITDDDNKSKGQ